ncbi:hypothetical protein [Niabella drilacis]|uniref:Peptidase MA superfamily protein n=1 Tax=Niabella drilacis (strain DSM 25811 / CCM 8410 / CCUG 62505 / LMG 26954 / E90) TaxID=1285928 RepID=A0A1G6VIX5_NIADE|nr:hypothetical protein [Niabella drilacis]SDD53343.1 hypothetical protein SAMN04487894_11034 [Niabella drilacis]
MKRIFLLISFVATAHCISAQRLAVNLSDQNNINPLYKKDLLIRTLDSFFTYGGDGQKSGKYWDKKDLNFFGYPFDLTTYGYNGKGESFLRPVFLGAIDFIPRRQYLVKIAFLPFADSLKGNMGRVVNLIANYDKATDGFTFERYTNYFTRDWYQLQVGNILFYKELKATFSIQQAKACNRYNDSIAAVFKVPPKKIIYYSCKDPVQMFNLMGYDFRYEMFLSRTGGRAEWGGVKPPLNHFIYSGNNKEYYPHEIAHFYIGELYTTNEPCRIAYEGIATYIGGTEQKPLRTVGRSLYQYLQKYRNVSVSQLLFEDVRTDDDVSRLYAAGGILAGLIYEKKGLEGWRQFLALPCSKMEEALPLLLGTRKTLKQAIIDEAKKISEGRR